MQRPIVAAPGQWPQTHKSPQPAERAIAALLFWNQEAGKDATRMLEGALRVQLGRQAWQAPLPQ
jgi:hypothetical protein